MLTNRASDEFDLKRPHFDSGVAAAVVVAVAVVVVADSDEVNHLVVADVVQEELELFELLFAVLFFVRFFDQILFDQLAD